mmetsp:Transcript_16958/g.42036  ORF Transcript_16958/g.42036 Transcript_16958/m.42036 type:complete len:200 (-) Transcript_16958:5299-5898(-)
MSFSRRYKGSTSAYRSRCRQNETSDPSPSFFSSIAACVSAKLLLKRLQFEVPLTSPAFPKFAFPETDVGACTAPVLRKSEVDSPSSMNFVEDLGISARKAFSRYAAHISSSTLSFRPRSCPLHTKRILLTRPACCMMKRTTADRFRKLPSTRNLARFTQGSARVPLVVRNRPMRSAPRCALALPLLCPPGKVPSLLLSR